VRDIILARIAEIRRIESNFPKDTMKWRNIYFGEANSTMATHASLTDFTMLSDDALADSFETILCRFYRQM